MCPERSDSEPDQRQGVEREFVQPKEAPSFFSDYVHITNTGTELILQFYETRPGAPKPPEGEVKDAESVLRATVQVTPQHAARLLNTLAQHMEALDYEITSEEEPE